VVTGLRQDDFVEILEGVQAGDRIVADGLNKVQPGQPVRVVGPGGDRSARGRPPGGHAPA
jgi:membrane fusion protein (multidrug efflux system)